MIKKIRTNSCRLLCAGEQATGFLISPRQILTVTHLIVVDDGQPLPEITAIFQSEVGKAIYPAILVKRLPPLMVLELEQDVPFYEKMIFLEREPDHRNRAMAFGFPSFAPKGCFANLTVNTLYANEDDSFKSNLLLDCNNRSGSLMGMSGSALIIDDEISGILLQEICTNGEAFLVCALAGLHFRQAIAALELPIEIDNSFVKRPSNNIETICRLNRENTALRSELNLVQNQRLSEIMKTHFWGEEIRALDMLKQEIFFLEQSPSMQQSSAAYFLLAALWTCGSDHELSEKYLYRAMEIDQTIDTRIIESEMALMNQDFEHAEAVLTPIDNTALLNQKGKILYYKGDLDAALSCFTESTVSLNDGSQILLAIIYLKRGTYRDGLSIIKPLLNRYPNSAKLLAIKAHLLFGEAIANLCPQIQYGQGIFVDPHYFLPNSNQQAALARAYLSLENLLNATEHGENPILREWAYGMLVSTSMILPGKDARLWMKRFQKQYPHSSLLVLSYLVCNLPVPENLAEEYMKQPLDSIDDLQIKIRLLIHQNCFNEADTLLQTASAKFTQFENTSFAGIRFSLFMQKQDWASASDLVAKEPNGTSKRRMQFLLNAWSGKQSKKVAAKKLLDFAKETTLPMDFANAYHFACAKTEWWTALKIAKFWYQAEPQLMVLALQAELLTNLGREKKALSLIEAIEKEGGHSRFLLKLKARCLQVLGRQDEAIVLLENIKYEENDYDLLLLRARTFLQLGQREDAVVCLKEYLDHDYKNNDVLSLLIEILKSTDLKEACRYAMLQHQLYPEDRLALSQAVHLCMLSGTICPREDYEQFNQLSVDRIAGFRQCDIAEALEIVRERNIQIENRSAEYRNMKYPIHIYVDALQNQPMGYLLYLQWRIGIMDIIYPLFAANPANLTFPDESQIILDYTACISAYELGILDEICDRWHCKISAHLLPIILQDLSQLNSIQVSQEESNFQLKNQLDSAKNLAHYPFTKDATCLFDALYQTAKEENLYIVCDDPLKGTGYIIPDDWNQYQIPDNTFLSYLVTLGVLSSYDLEADEYTPDLSLAEKKGFLLGTSILNILAEKELLVSVTDSIKAQILTVQYDEICNHVQQTLHRRNAHNWLKKIHDKLADLISRKKLSLLSASGSKGDDEIPQTSLLREEVQCWKDKQMILWCDDKFINRMNDPTLRIVGILDILENLYQRNSIHYKRKLDDLLSRHVGGIIPDQEHVLDLLKSCPENTGVLRESTALKNWKETVCGTLNLPNCLINEPRDNRISERQIYMKRLFAMLIDVLIAIWNEANRPESWQRAASDWLIRNLFILFPDRIDHEGLFNNLQYISSGYLIIGLLINREHKKCYFDWLCSYLILEWKASPNQMVAVANDIGNFVSAQWNKVGILYSLNTFKEMIPFEGFLYELFKADMISELDYPLLENHYTQFLPGEEGPFLEPSPSLLEQFIFGNPNAVESILTMVFMQPVTFSEYIVQHLEHNIAKGVLPSVISLASLYFYVPVHLRETVRNMYAKTLIHVMMSEI